MSSSSTSPPVSGSSPANSNANAANDDLQIVSVIGANGQPLPLIGNSIGSDWSTPVKQERADDAEIREMAAKMKEAQKDILAKQQQQAAQLANRHAMQAANGLQAPLTNGNGQTNILNFISRQQKPMTNGGGGPGGGAAASTAAVTAAGGAIITNGTASSTTNGGQRSLSGTSLANGGAGNGADDRKAPCDEESLKGHFGWAQFGKTCIPYIFRQQEKYCSVRMIELKLLGKYLNCLHPDIYSSCTCVRSYYITEAEARLFIEINHKHCDGEFGRDIFTPKDLVVRLCDATKFYQFLDICYRKLVSGSKTPSEKCGFIRINKESVVPYTVRNGAQVVPLFYFEGETENLKTKAELLTGWDLAYLKFCCKVQGIRNELFSSENVAVISLTDIKSYFPNGTEFEDYWPSKVVDSNLLIGGNRSNVSNSVNWTRQPTAPPPKTISNTAQKSNTHSAAAAQVVAAQQQQILKQRAAAAAAAAGHNAANGVAAAVAAANAFNSQAAAAAAGNQRMLAQATVQALANGSWMSGQGNLSMLHPQMLAQQQSHANTGRVQYRNPMENLMLNSQRQPYPYNNAAAISMSTANNHSQGNAPPPLVRSAAGQNMSTNDEQSLLQQQQHQQTQQQQLLLQQQQSQRHFNNNNSHNRNHASTSSSSTAAVASSSSLSSLSTSPSPSQCAIIANTNSTNNNLISGGNTAAAAAAAAAAAILGSTYMNNLPSTPADFTNLTLWNQLTAAQRLLLTQQMKNNHIASGGGGGNNLTSTGGGAAVGGGNSSQKSTSAGDIVYPPLPSLPLDTDLITMLDYNPNKSTTHNKTHNTKLATTSVGAGSSAGGGGTFTKPSVPPLLSTTALDSDLTITATNSAFSSGAAKKRSATNSSSSSSGGGGTSTTTVPLNNTQALEDFEKKFKMTDEMRAVVQKVLANPDLSTFIQTNASNNFVPFMSPPMSPALGLGGSNSNNSSAAAATTLSLVSNPNVTITPQLPANFLHSPSSSSCSSAASTNASSPIGTAATRQKSVICSTKSSASTSSSPSPTLLHNNRIPTTSTTTSFSSSSHSHYHHNPNSHQQRRQHHHHHHHHLNNHNNNNNNQQQNNNNTPPMEVIDLSSSRRSLPGATTTADYLMQQQAAVAAAAATQKRLQAAAVAHQQTQQQQQQNGRSSTIIERTMNASATIHLQRHAASAAAAAAAAAASNDGGSSRGSQRLSVIPEIPTNNMNVHPYKVQKVYVDKHLVPCINMKAYNDSDQLMTLTDFQKYFFPSVALDHCKRLIEALGVELYKGNRHQVQILIENDRSYNENIPLVQVRDVIKYMTQLTFMTRNPEQPPAKRTRAS